MRKYEFNIKTVKGNIIVQSEALEQYPLCEKPYQMRLKSVVRPTKQPPLHEWFFKIYKDS